MQGSRNSTSGGEEGPVESRAEGPGTLIRRGLGFRVSGLGLGFFKILMISGVFLEVHG